MGENSQNLAVVIGGGHAGIEASLALSRLGIKTTLVTLKKDRIGFMSCNPAIGGIAKGQLVREIDALGGQMGLAIDQTGIQFKQLNSTKGPAVRSPRAQADKDLYRKYMIELCLNAENLNVLEAEVSKINWDRSRNIKSVQLSDGSEILCRVVLITAGTFLRAKMFVGDEKSSGGRVGDVASSLLSEQLLSLGIELGRFKTGTPPRLDSKTINWEVLESQGGDKNPKPFSFYTVLHNFPIQNQLNCALTYTNNLTHQIVEDNLVRSPLFKGDIVGLGPRYCPSIEDKVVRFKERDKHQIFLEPEGLSTNSVYVNGVSTSLPKDTQLKFLRSINGLESCEVLQFGYAVEYDYILSRQLSRTLELKDCPGLFFAGQVNGTSGYEEAAAQGLMAGINAAHFILNRDPFILRRDEAYIGVLIDDLVLKGTEEPYRMFTSRAEHRLFLRSDNADKRLSEKGFKIGLLPEHFWRKTEDKLTKKEVLTDILSKNHVFPVESELEWLKSLSSAPIKNKTSLLELLKRHEIGIDMIMERLVMRQRTGHIKGEIEINVDEILSGFDMETIEIEARYGGYLEKEAKFLKSTESSMSSLIPKNTDFKSIPGISTEISETLFKYQPETLDQAKKLYGVTPAALAVLSLYVRKLQNDESNIKNL